MGKDSIATEASVGDMLPITKPDEVLRKEGPLEPSIDDEFAALQLGLSDTENDPEEEIVEEDAVVATMLTFEVLAIGALIAVPVAYHVMWKKAVSAIENYYSAKDKKFVPMKDCIRKTYMIDFSKFNTAKQDGSLDPQDVKQISGMKYGKEIIKFKWLRGKKNKVQELWYGKELCAAFIVDVETQNGGGTSSNGDCVSVTTYSNKLYLALGKRFQKYKEFYTNYILYKFADSEKGFKAIRQLAKKLTVYEEEGYDPDSHGDLLEEAGITSVYEQYKDTGVDTDDMIYFLEEWEEDKPGADDLFMEAANIDDDMKEIVSELNRKGYKTLYSCSGHPSARLKSDRYKDGIKHGKLYSTARIVFKKQYADFKDTPTGWDPKDCGDGKFGIYVKGPSYNIINGMAVEQFYRWKKRYMYHLKKWVDDLPDNGAKQESGQSKKEGPYEEGNEYVESLLEEIIMDAYTDPLIDD